MVRFIIILLVIYIGGYVAVRFMNMQEGADGAAGTVVYSKDMEILATIFSPLAMLDEELTGTKAMVDGAEPADTPEGGDEAPAAGGDG